MIKLKVLKPIGEHLPGTIVKLKATSLDKFKKRIQDGYLEVVEPVGQISAPVKVVGKTSILGFVVCNFHIFAA